jgi:hypothetical protein
VTDKNVVSGNCFSPKPIECAGDKCIYYDEGLNLERAKETAKKGDVVLVYVNTESSEGSDRKTLNLDDDTNDLIAALAAVNKNIIVIVTCPEAVLTPWRD